MPMCIPRRESIPRGVDRFSYSVPYETGLPAVTKEVLPHEVERNDGHEGSRLKRSFIVCLCQTVPAAQGMSRSLGLRRDGAPGVRRFSESRSSPQRLCERQRQARQLEAELSATRQLGTHASSSASMS